MILDFSADPLSITQDTVGGKFYNLYHLNRIPGLSVPPAFCITAVDFDPHEITNHIDPSQKYAVRSSAREEDQVEFSAAGIFESYLNVQGKKDILQAIKKCFASAKTTRARTYFRHLGRGSDDLKMSVIVQEMIPAQKSGVFFTRNPLNQANEIYIEMISGLGDKLVSGAVSPETFILNPEAEVQDALLKKIKDSALVLGRVYEHPQDVEWAWYSDNLYILQSRPVISRRKNIYRPEEVWTRANIGEIIPKPLTPLSLGIFNSVMSKAYRVKYYSIVDRFFTNIIHLIPRKGPLFRYPRSFVGHLYLNLETILKAFGAEPWVNREILELGLGFTIPSNVQSEKQLFSEKLVSLIKNIIFMIEYVFPVISMEKRALRFLRLKIKELRLKKDGEIPDILLKINRFAFGWHIAATARCFSHLGFIIKINRFMRNSSLSKNALISILSRYNADMHSREFTSLFEAPESRKINGKLQNKISTNDVIPAVMNGEFLQIHGHRSANEFELAQPSWQEDPSPLIELMENINSKRVSHPNVKQHLKFIQKLVINRLVAAIQLREGLKSELIRAYKEFRTYYLKVGKALVGKNVLKEPEDIFFLDPAEVDKVPDSPNGFTFNMEKRKQGYQETLETRLPQTFYGNIPWTSDAMPGEKSTTFLGIGCSEGFVTGRAMVIDITSPVRSVPADTIIVTRSADPGWTPMLLTARGMIAEYGGILSHIASIAREHQKPLIVGIENITRRIRDGQTIMMDGKSGRVEIVAELNS